MKIYGRQLTTASKRTISTVLSDFFYLYLLILQENIRLQFSSKFIHLFIWRCSCLQFVNCTKKQQQYQNNVVMIMPGYDCQVASKVQLNNRKRKKTLINRTHGFFPISCSFLILISFLYDYRYKVLFSC